MNLENKNIVLQKINSGNYNDSQLAHFINDNSYELNDLSEINLDILCEKNSYNILSTLLRCQLLFDESYEKKEKVVRKVLESKRYHFMMNINLYDIEFNQKLINQVIKTIYENSTLKEFKNYMYLHQNYTQKALILIENEENILELIKSDFLPKNVSKKVIDKLVLIFKDSNDFGNIYNFVLMTQNNLNTNNIDCLVERIIILLSAKDFKTSNRYYLKLLTEVSGYSENTKIRLIKLIESSKIEKDIIHLIIFVDIKLALKYFKTCNENLRDSLENMLTYLCNKDDDNDFEIASLSKILYKDNIKSRQINPDFNFNLENNNKSSFSKTLKTK